MSNESKRTQGSPGDFEDKINAAMADLELDEDDDFHDADFYDEEADAPFDSLDQDEENSDEEAEEEEEAVQDGLEEDFEEEYPEEEEYEGAEEDFSEEEEPAQKELQVELIQPHSQGKKHSRKSGRGRAFSFGTSYEDLLCTYFR